MSPSVCPRPQYCSTRSPRSPPRSMVSRSENVSVGQVSPGTESACSDSRGIRANSDCPVLLAALGDQRPGVLVRDDHLGVERAGAQHPHGVVVRQHQVAHGLVGVLAQQGQPARAPRRAWPSPRSRRGSPRPRRRRRSGRPRRSARRRRRRAPRGSAPSRRGRRTRRTAWLPPARTYASGQPRTSRGSSADAPVIISAADPSSTAKSSHRFAGVPMSSPRSASTS